MGYIKENVSPFAPCNTKSDQNSCTNYVSGNIILQTCLSQDSTWKNKLVQLTDLLDSADKLFVSN